MCVLLAHQWVKNRETAAWGSADAVCIPIPKFDDEDDGNYAKSTVRRCARASLITPVSS